jgi:hypothetical protein
LILIKVKIDEVIIEFGITQHDTYQFLVIK